MQSRELHRLVQFKRFYSAEQNTKSSTYSILYHEKFFAVGLR